MPPNPDLTPDSGCYRRAAFSPRLVRRADEAIQQWQSDTDPAYLARGLQHIIYLVLKEFQMVVRVWGGGSSSRREICTAVGKIGAGEIPITAGGFGDHRSRHRGRDPQSCLWFARVACPTASSFCSGVASL